MALNKMVIPTFIANQEFDPAQVRPRAYFYNGKLETNPYTFETRTGVASTFVQSINYYPYFDHYSTGSGAEVPSTDSDSLLFYNETPTLGSIPAESLYTTYWSKYVGLLYDPKTRLIEGSAIIPVCWA